jgi:4-amino-4-deoxy-L-arabinose transferase-like glycosyltransferase
LTAERAAPPSRIFLIVTLLVVLVFTVLRLMTAANLDLRSDEAYYCTWSHQAPLSFLDQPPMVAWFERFGQLFFGDTALGARFAQILALPLIELILADIARRRTRRWNAALFVVLAMECALNYGFFAIVIEPSAALLLFTSLILWALCRLDETGDARWWLLVGAAGGLALLSKYIVLLIAPALLLYLLLRPAQRRWLRTPWPYAAIGLALLLFSPVLAWNAQHGWASFAFQSVRLGSGEPPSLGGAMRFVMYESLFAGPVLLVAAVVAASATAVGYVRGRKPAYELMLAAAFLVPILFLFWRSFTLLINQSWAWFVWPIGLLTLAIALPWDRARLRIAGLLVLIGAPGLLVNGALFYHVLWDTSVWGGAGDPIGQDAGFGEMAQAVLSEAKANGAGWIATSDYRTYANLQWHIGKDIPVLQVNERARFLDFAPRDPARFTGRALYVHQGAATPVLAEATLTGLPNLPVSWRGVTMQTMQVDLLDGFTPELSPPPGSAAYVWKY